MEEYTELEMEKVKNLFTNETGYQTPKMDVRGVIFQDNKILLVKEKIDDRWSLPGGFCEIGLSPSENIIKEIKKESGFDVTPTKVLAVLDKNKYSHPPDPYHYYKIFIQCEVIGGKAETGIETKGVKYHSEKNLPRLSVSRNIESQVKLLFEFLRSPNKDTIFD